MEAYSTSGLSLIQSNSPKRFAHWIDGQELAGGGHRGARADATFLGPRILLDL